MSIRHPLRSRAAVISVLTALAQIATAAGLDALEVERWVEVALFVVEALVALGVLVKGGENDVTPVLDPRTLTGRPARLVPLDGGQLRFEDMD